MKKSIFIFIFIFTINIVFAGDLELNTSGELNYSNPADSIALGDIIDNSWRAVGESEACTWNAYGNWAKLQARGAFQNGTGITTEFEGVTYDVFSTGIPGIGIAVGLKTSETNEYMPLKNSSYPVTLYPEPGSSPDNSSIHVQGRALFVKTQNHLSTGTYVIPRMQISWMECYYKTSVTQMPKVYLNPVTVNVVATGCEVTSPSNAYIDFGFFKHSDFPSIGSVSQKKSVIISLDCDPGINLHAVVSDQTNKSNRTDVINLSPDSTAKGLGVQALNINTDSPYLLGPDDSSAGAANMFFLQNTGSGGFYAFPIDFRYIRTGTLEAGSANALVGITLSYQ